MSDGWEDGCTRLGESGNSAMNDTMMWEVLWVR
jgi:hypothetical protein